jgi:hypothetical protein
MKIQPQPPVRGRPGLDFRRSPRAVIGGMCRTSPDVRFQGIVESIVRCGFGKTKPGLERLPPDSHSLQARQRAGRITLSHRPMSSDRLFLEGLVATRAPLRFTGTINLPCTSAWPLQTGHFYFARRRTFLLCLDTACKPRCKVSGSPDAIRNRLYSRSRKPRAVLLAG